MSRQSPSRVSSKTYDSRSRSRSRGRYSYSDASFTDSYSSGDDYSRGKRASPQKTKSHDTGVSKKGNKGQQKGNQNKKKASAQQITIKPMDFVTKRMLSARRIKINELRNEIEALHVELVDLRQENKTLKRQQLLHSKALDRYEEREHDVPNMMQRHSEELRNLREQHRRQKEKYSKANKKLRDTEDELDNTKRLLRKMKGLVDDKKLGERDDLSQKLTKLEGELFDKDKKIKGLERHVENLQKNHRHEMGIERARYRDTQQQLASLQEEMSKVYSQLKEREKELDVRNIYSKRLLKAPHRLSSSITSSPLPEPVFSSRPPPRKPKPAEPPEPTPREKMKQYEEKRREEERLMREKQQEIAQNKPSPKVEATNVVVEKSESDGEETRLVLREKSDINIVPEEPVTPAVTETETKMITAPKKVKKFKTPRSTKINTTPQSDSKITTASQKETKKAAPLHSETKIATPAHKTSVEQRPSQKYTDVLAENHHQRNLVTKKSHSKPTQRRESTENEPPIVPSHVDITFDSTSEKNNVQKPQKQTSKTPTENKGYVPTFLTEPAREERKSKPETHTDNSLFDLASPATPTKPKVGRRAKPEGITHLVTEEDSPEVERKSPVMFDLSASGSQTSKKPASKRTRPAGTSTMLVVEEDSSHPWEKENDDKRREQEQKEREENRKQIEMDRQGEEVDEVDEVVTSEEEDLMEQREKIKQEAIALKELEDQARVQRMEAERRERAEREERERREEERRQHEERVRREREEEERRIEEERKRREFEIQDAEQRKQKDLLLQKMKEIDSDQLTRTSSKQKEYNFKQSIENMHHGKPAYDDVTVPVLERQKKRNSLFDSEDDDVGAYKPSFSGKRSQHRGSKTIEDNVLDFSGPPKAEKKTELMENLFGKGSSSGKSKQSNSSDLFSGENSQKTSSGRRDSLKKEQSGKNLFGARNGVASDEHGGSNNAQLLHRRSKQPTTTLQSRPAINAIDDFDDDIEEVVL